MPDAVILAASPDRFSEARAIDLADFGTIAGEWRDARHRHMVVADRDGDHRISVLDPAPNRRLAILVPLDGSFRARVEGAHRFFRRLTGHSSGPRPRALRITPQRRSRLILMLRALDGHLAGANYRAIAVALLDRSVATLPAREWKTSSWRARAIRLVRDAVATMNGGYRKLLAGN